MPFVPFKSFRVNLGTKSHTRPRIYNTSSAASVVIHSSLIQAPQSQLNQTSKMPSMEHTNASSQLESPSNLDLLFLPATNATKPIQGFTYIQEERLFMNFPKFVISETILGIYVKVSILLYIRRPGRYLPRMPISIAAVVQMFAPSAAVKDLRNTCGMTNKERDKYLDDLECYYDYGSYVGSDGAVHAGTEKAPYVQCLKEVTFTGSKAEREFRKRTVQHVSSIAPANSTEYVHVPDVDHVERNRGEYQTNGCFVSPLEALLPHDLSVGFGRHTLHESVHEDRGNDVSTRRITV